MNNKTLLLILIIVCAGIGIGVFSYFQESNNAGTVFGLFIGFVLVIAAVIYNRQKK